MKTILLPGLFLALLAVLPLGAVELIYSQPCPDLSQGGSFYNSSYAPAANLDFEVADNFSGLNDPITRIVFYGLSVSNDGAYAPVLPAPGEPFSVRFYSFSTHQIPADPGLLAPQTGLYAVSLYDLAGDGWDSASLDVFVNGILAQGGLTFADGAGPVTYYFSATAGDYITTVYHAGTFADENWYQVSGPDATLLATDGPVPQGIGHPAFAEADEPDWFNPVAFCQASASIIQVGNFDDWPIYEFTLDLPAPVTLASGWVSVQIDAAAGSGALFLWSEGLGGDGLCHQRSGLKGQPGRLDLLPLARAAKPRLQEPKVAVNLDMAFALYADSPQQQYTFAVTAHDAANPTGPDLGAQIWLDAGSGEAFTGHLTPYTFTHPGDWFPGTYFLQHPDYSGWNPESASFASLEANSAVDFLGTFNGSVPVELSGFSASPGADNSAWLSWTTQSEADLAGYIVHRASESALANAVAISGLIGATNSSQQQTYVFADTELFAAGTYYYWLQAIDLDGSLDYFGPVSLAFSPGGEPGTPGAELVTGLIAAYPNPFISSTAIRYSVKEAGPAKVEIFNLRGQLIRSFASYHSQPGYYQVSWDGSDFTGRYTPSGVYTYRLSFGNYASMKTLVLIK